MTETDWETTIKGLSQQLASIRNRALADSIRFEELRRQAESTKIQSLTYEFEARRKFLAQSRGVASLKKNPNKLPAAGLLAVGLVLNGIFAKDWLTVGTKGVKDALRGLGETKWIVCLGQNLKVAPWDNIRHGGIWVTWESLMIALDELVVRAKDESLGNLDNIITELLKNENIVFLPPPLTDWTAYSL